MPYDARNRLNESGADHPTPDGPEVSSRSKTSLSRACHELFGNAAFAALVFLIIAFMPLGVLYDLLPRRGLQHHSRGWGNF